jgi:hypothetical protein
MKDKVQWFDRDATAEAIAKSERFMRRAQAQLEQLHAAKSVDRATKLQRDCERVETALRAQIVNTFEPDTEPTDARPTSHTSDEYATDMEDSAPSRNRVDDGLTLSRAIPDMVDPTDTQDNLDAQTRNDTVPRHEPVGTVHRGASPSAHLLPSTTASAREPLSAKADALTEASNRVRQIKATAAAARAKQRELAEQAMAKLAAARKARATSLTDADDEDAIPADESPADRAMRLLIERRKRATAAAATATHNEEAE